MERISYDEWVRMKDCLDRLDKNINGNGKPPLEDRLKKYADEKDTHKQGNWKQDLADMKYEIQTRHNENTEKMDKFSDKMDTQTRLIYIGMGIVITLEALGIFKVHP